MLLCWRRFLRVPWPARKSNQWILKFGRTDAEPEAPGLWPLDVKKWLIGKDPDAGKDWRQEEKETTEDEMVGWHHRLRGHEFEQTPGNSEGQGRCVCCCPWGPKASGRMEQLNWFIILAPAVTGAAASLPFVLDHDCYCCETSFMTQGLEPRTRNCFRSVLECSEFQPLCSMERFLSCASVSAASCRKLCDVSSLSV